MAIIVPDRPNYDTFRDLRCVMMAFWSPVFHLQCHKENVRERGGETREKLDGVKAKKKEAEEQEIETCRDLRDP